jgi:hypothetical protein
MAAGKRKPAIERPEGVWDDLIIPVIRKTMKGSNRKKTIRKLAKQFEKKANIAEMKMHGKVYKKEKNVKNVDKPTVTSYSIRKQAKKSYVYGARANALYLAQPTRGLAKKAKKRAPKAIENENYIPKGK